MPDSILVVAGHGPQPQTVTGPGGGPPLDYVNSLNAVDKAFSDVFNRAPYSADINYWVPKGYGYVDDANGVLAFEQLIRSNLATQPEAWNDINGIFWSILNRGDDAGGIASTEGLLPAARSRCRAGASASPTPRRRRTTSAASCSRC